MGFGRCDLLLGEKNRGRELGFLELDSISNGFGKKLACKFKGLLWGLGIKVEVMNDLLRRVDKRFKAEHLRLKDK